MRDAFLRGRRQQRLERHVHIDAFGGAEPVRHQIKPLQAEHMIEPDRAGVAHRGAQHLAIRLERLQFEAGGIEPGKAPVLPRGIERVRRRTNRKMAGNRRLLLPRVEAVGLHADGDVEIKPDLHSEPDGKVPARLQLPVGASIARIRRTRFRLHRRPREVRHHRASSGWRHSSGHSHQGFPENLCRSTSKQANRDSIAPRSARNFAKSCWRSAMGLALKASKAIRSARSFSSATAG